MRVLDEWPGGPKVQGDEVIVVLSDDERQAIRGCLVDRFHLIGAYNYKGSPVTEAETRVFLDEFNKTYE